LFNGVATAQTVVVQFLDGRNGKPVTKARVYIGLDSGKRGEPLDLRPNSRGEVEFDIGSAKTFQVTAVGEVPCHEEGVAVFDYSIEQVRRTGIVTSNNCGRMKVEPASGRLTYFVRPATWWELFKN
jgi:hypothetical protein